MYKISIAAGASANCTQRSIYWNAISGLDSRHQHLCVAALKASTYKHLLCFWNLSLLWTTQHLVCICAMNVTVWVHAPFLFLLFFFVIVEKTYEFLKERCKEAYNHKLCIHQYVSVLWASLWARWLRQRDIRGAVFATRTFGLRLSHFL